MWTQQIQRRLASLALCALLLTSCAFPGDAAPVLKIGLIAPFEGLGRPLGYAVLPAVKIALAEANGSGALGRYRVALVALNDDLDGQTAAQQAQALAQDADVLAVLGPWTEAAAMDAVPILAQAGIPVLSAAPLADIPPEAQSLCPSPDQLARALVARARPAGALEMEAAGPDNTLRLALASRPGVAGFAPAQDTPTGEALVLYSGDAASGAEEMARWRAAGWLGAMWGGPDFARSWLIGLAGAAAEGAQAVVCAPSTPVSASFPAAYQAQTGSLPGPEAVLAYSGAQAILQALATDVAAHGRPLRSGLAAALAARPVEPGLVWLRVEQGQWVQP